MEVFARQNQERWQTRGAAGDDLDFITSPSGERFVNLTSRIQRFPSIMSSVAMFCGIRSEQMGATLDILQLRQPDEHPFGTDRLRGIFLAHPEVKKAIGCRDASISVAQKEDFKNDTETGQKPRGERVYCGSELYKKQ
jgi:hypothetical protein